VATVKKCSSESYIVDLWKISIGNSTYHEPEDVLTQCHVLMLLGSQEMQANNKAMP
jgi:hypothetical protein